MPVLSAGDALMMLLFGTLKFGLADEGCIIRPQCERTSSTQRKRLELQVQLDHA